MPSALPLSRVCPTPDPKAAADELERTVTKYGFKGAMIHGLTNGVFHDNQRFWPIYERAAALDVPIYIQAGYPHPAVVRGLLQGLSPPPIPISLSIPRGASASRPRRKASASSSARCSTAIRACRSSSAISARDCPSFSGASIKAWRSSGNKAEAKGFRDVFCEHFYITTSGFFSDPALRMLHHRARASTGCCSRSIIRSSPTSLAWNGGSTRSNAQRRRQGEDPLGGQRAAALEAQGLAARGAEGPCAPIRSTRSLPRSPPSKA